MRRFPTIQTTARSPILQVLKTSIAVIAAWVLCAAIFPGAAPIFAAIAALIVVQPSVNQSLAKGIERSVGVILGVVLAYGVGFVFGNQWWVVLAAVVLSLLAAWALKLGPGSANQIPISAMLVLTMGTLVPAYAAERIIETIIGAGIGLAVNIAIVPPVLLRPAHLAVARLGREVAASMDRLGLVLHEPSTPAQLQEMLAKARTLRGLREAAEDAVARGDESLTLNPRHGRHRRVLQHDVEVLSRLGILVTRVLGMSRAVHDHYSAALTTDPAVIAIATELGRAAHDVRLIVRDVEGTSEPVTSEIPALTAPLRVLRPNEDNWILIGSLMEDMRRVRAEIVGSEER
jgi:uncharacterized membrane protein YccC